MDRIMEQLSKLQELSEDELNELESLAVSEFKTAREAELSAETVATMNKLADATEAVRTEKARRVTEAQTLQAEAAAAAARIEPQAEAADASEEEPAAEVTVEVPVEDVPVEVPAVEEEEKAAEAAVSDIPAEDEDEDEDEDEESKEPVAAAAEAAVETPAAAEAAVETPAAAEAAVETPAAAEAAAETAEAAADQPAEAEAAVAPAAEPETPAAAEASIQENQNNVQEDNVTADAAPQGTGDLAIEAPAGRQPKIQPATTLSITAGADVPGYSSGAKLTNSLEVADAFAKRLHSLRNVHGGDGEQHIVASYVQEFPANRQLSTNDPQENTDKIQGVTSLEAITAAAGVCTPLEQRYDLGCDVGVTDRPVRDALARFGSDRGGIRYFSAPKLEDAFGATGFWRSTSSGGARTWTTYGSDRTTATNPAGQKPCLEVQCTQELDAYIEAVTLCLTFNNLTTRTFPELIKRHNELALVAHARAAENALLAQIEAGSSAVTMPTQVIGAAREIFNVLAKAVSAYRFKHRMNAVAPLRMIAPVWVRDFVKADLAMQMPGDGLDDTIGVADAKIDAWFRSRGVNITWHLDGNGPGIVDLDGPTTGTAPNETGTGTDMGFVFPETIEFALFAEGTWLFLDGGTLDLGVIRDSSLVATNQYKQFVETFEGVANVGCDSYWMSANLQPTGAAAALVDTLV